MKTELLSFVDRLLGVRSENTVSTSLLEFFQEMGTEGGNIWYATGLKKKASENSGASSYPTSFIDRMYSPEIMRTRQIPKIVAQSTAITFWGVDIDERRFGKDSTDYLLSKEAISEFGLRTSAIVPVPMVNRQGSSGVSFFTKGDNAKLDAILKERGFELIHAAFFTHAYLQKIRGEKLSDHVLSKREKECLLWLSRGFRTKEISFRMNIKEVTVTMHLTNARKKLGAKTREQALARAIIEGVICP